MYCLTALQPVPPHSGRPRRRGPAPVVQDPAPAPQLFARQALPEHALCADVGRQGARKKRAHFVAKGEFFVGEAQVHVKPPMLRVSQSRYQVDRAAAERHASISSAPQPSVEGGTRVLRCERRRRHRRRQGRCRAEARRGRRLHDAVDLDERLPRHEMRVLGASSQSSTGATQASIGSNTRTHSLARLLAEHRGQIALWRAARSPGRSADRAPPRRCRAAVQELGVEFRFDRADRHPSSVGALVHVVEMRAGISEVAAALGRSMPAACMPKKVVASDAVPSTIAASTTCPRPELRASRIAASSPNARYSEPPRVVADEIERERWRRVAPADGVQYAGDGDVVDVVTGRLGQRALLAPAGHPTVDASRGLRARQASGPRPMRSVTPGRKPSINASARSMSCSAASTPCGSLRSSAMTWRLRSSRLNLSGRSMPSSGRLLAIDADHRRTEVREQHGAHRPRPDAGQFDDPHAGERAQVNACASPVPLLVGPVLHGARASARRRPASSDRRRSRSGHR